MRRRAVAVDKREFGLRFGQKRRADDRIDRGDAAAGRDREITMRGVGRERRVKASFGRRDGNLAALRQLVAGPARKAAVRHFFDGDLKLSVLHGIRDRIGAALFRPADRGLERQVLPVREFERIAERRRNGEREGDGIARFRAPACDLEGVKAVHLSAVLRRQAALHLKNSKGSAQRVQRARPLHGVEPNALTISVSCDPQRGQARAAFRTGGAIP